MPADFRAIVPALLLALCLRGETVVTTPFIGVTHIVRTEDAPRKVSMHVVKVDLTTAGLSFKLTAPSGSRETVRQTTLDYLKQEKAQLAINAHFFVPYPSTDQDSFLVGFAASNGNVYSDFEQPVQSYAIVANAPAINLSANNQASLFGPGTLVRETIWNAISGSSQIITKSRSTVPVYKDEEHPDGLLTPGGPGDYSNSKSWYDVPNARTVIGLSDDFKTLFLFTVDRAGGSLGMKLSEIADLLIHDYGVANALNLDGGGSTTLAMEDPDPKIVNVPADNAKGRAVASNLAVFVEKIANR